MDDKLTFRSSSGQQLLTAIQPRVSKLVHFIRQPNWITGPFGDAPQDYAIEQIEEFKSDDMKLLSKRKKIESVINSTFGSFLRSSPLQNGMRQFLTQAMQAKVREGGLLDELIPTFAPGCRRPTPGLGYLEALAQPNVEVVIGDIHGIASKGLVDNTGREHDVDVIICATGFDTTHIPSFSIVGLEGKSLQNLWAEDVTDSYFATTVPYMPNYATFFGPFCPSVSGSYVRNIGMYRSIPFREHPVKIYFQNRGPSGLHSATRGSISDRERPLICSVAGC